MSIRLLALVLLFVTSVFATHCVSTTRANVAYEERHKPLRSQIVEAAYRELGDQYRYAAKGPDQFDCSGLVYFVYNQFDIELSGGSRHQIQQGKKLRKIEDADPGDLVFFSKYENGKGPVNHVGIVVANSDQDLRIIHSTSRGVVEDEVYTSKYWSMRLLQANDIISTIEN